VPLWNDRRHEHGPFDIIGDVHGCCDELVQLLDRLGYTAVLHGRVTRPEKAEEDGNRAADRRHEERAHDQADEHARNPGREPDGIERRSGKVGPVPVLRLH